MKIEQMVNMVNIALELDEQKLISIGADVCDDFEDDDASRAEWLDRSSDWTELAMQVTEDKTYPWPNAANIKYPLLTIASLQFNARAYPGLIPDYEVVKGRVIGYDPSGEKAEKAARVGKFMSFQIFNKMKDWEQDMDKALLALPILGTMFKKTYFDPVDEQPCSHLIWPRDLVVNYYADSLEKARRVTHVIEMSKNDLKERQMAGIYLDVELANPNGMGYDNSMEARANSGMHKGGDTSDDPYVILEQHRFLDLDDDGYEEPYIVVVERDSQKVLRIVARYDASSIVYNADETLRKINPIHYFTKFPFIPNPDGGFYDLGFGILLGPINETVNTIINQLIDAGTMSNMQAGFLSRSVRLKGGETAFSPGEWKMVNATGDDLRKGIFPLPTREPSAVLFQLLSLLITSGKELATVSEIMTGKTPGQNTPATTTMAAVQEGMRVFTAIHKRLYRALSEEFMKLYKVNKYTLNDEEEFVDFGTNKSGVSGLQDFKDSKIDVVPAADPTLSSETQRDAQAQFLMGIFPVIPNKEEVLRLVLNAQHIPNVDVLMQAPQGQGQQQDPKAQAEARAIAAETQLKSQEAQMKLEIERIKAQNEQEVHQMKLQLERMKIENAQKKAMIDAHMSAQQAIQSGEQHANNMNMQQQSHQQNLAMAERSASHKEEMDRANAMSKQRQQRSKPQPKEKGAK